MVCARRHVPWPGPRRAFAGGTSCVPVEGRGSAGVEPCLWTPAPGQALRPGAGWVLGRRDTRGCGGDPGVGDLSCSTGGVGLGFSMVELHRAHPGLCWSVQRQAGLPLGRVSMPCTPRAPHGDKLRVRMETILPFADPPAAEGGQGVGGAEPPREPVGEGGRDRGGRCEG